jgi:hypothetical protein
MGLSDLVLDAVALLQDRPPYRAGYLAVDWPRAVDDWPRLVEGVERGIAFLQQEKVLSVDVI